MEWQTTSAPCSNGLVRKGVAIVLSTISGTPALWATLARGSRSVIEPPAFHSPFVSQCTQQKTGRRCGHLTSTVEEHWTYRDSQLTHTTPPCNDRQPQQGPLRPAMIVSNEIAKQVRGQSSDHPRQSSYRTEVISVNEHALPAKALNGAPKLRDRATIEPVGRNENVARGHDSEKCKKLCGMP